MEKDKEVIQELDITQSNELFDYLINKNTKVYNINKALEEAVEFQEVLIKLQTKHKDNPKRPTEEDLVSEFADFILRGSVALAITTNLSVDDAMEKVCRYYDKKCLKLYGYLKEGKYKKGL